MSQVDPWEKAADCERALMLTHDPIYRGNLTAIREFWISLAYRRAYSGGLPAQRGVRGAPWVSISDRLLIEPSKATGANTRRTSSRCSQTYRCSQKQREIRIVHLQLCKIESISTQWAAIIGDFYR